MSARNETTSEHLYSARMLWLLLIQNEESARGRSWWMRTKVVRIFTYQYFTTQVTPYIIHSSEESVILSKILVSTTQPTMTALYIYFALKPSTRFIYTWEDTFATLIRFFYVLRRREEEKTAIETRTLTCQHSFSYPKKKHDEFFISLRSDSFLLGEVNSMKTFPLITPQSNLPLLLASHWRSNKLPSQPTQLSRFSCERRMSCLKKETVTHPSTFIS